ncbi:hypothetical protein B0H14DRAFT_2597379 [Mycena olivaceomarginata]|nr:hypothetical protein B0H14DRAFT_2597379 [Mycena olivaceomarginata]
MATASIAASISPGNLPPQHVDKVIDAASYKAAANRTVQATDLPGVVRRDALQKRDAGNVYLCTAANWEQYCVYITDAGPGECVNLAGDLNDLVSSFGPDPFQQCYLYSQVTLPPQPNTDDSNLWTLGHLIVAPRMVLGD